MSKLQANPEPIKLLSTRTKCFMCKHKFDKPAILPVDKPQRGKYQPNFNIEWWVHFYETHGMPKDYIPNCIFNSIYGRENTLLSVYGSERMLKIND